MNEKLGFNISNLAQLLGAYMNPGLPVANMYFTLYVSGNFTCSYERS
jgi:hypothetical protein